MQPLALNSLKIAEAGSDLPTREHIRSALARDLPEFAPAITFNDGHFVICGSGPSLPDFIEEIRQERQKGRFICAVKGAHDFLIDNGIEPDWFVSCEPRIRPLKHVSDRTTYLIASRCPPDLFDQVQGKQVIVWHSASSTGGPVDHKEGETLSWDQLDLTDECQEWKGHYAVGGPTTSGLRAVYLGFLSGFRNFTLYGMDSCLAKDKFTKRFSGENIGSGRVMDVIVAGRRFYCNGAMQMQAIEFQELYKGLPNVSIEAKGDGLIAAIIAERKKRGYRA